MPPDRDQAALLDIAKASRTILDFIRGLGEQDFLQDAKTQSAVIHQLLIVGEATKRLSAAFRAAHSDIPWARIARMRDLMIHHYAGVRPAEVWRAADTDVPALLKLLEPLLPKE